MNEVYITDYISNPDIEINILKEHLSKDLHKNISILLVWNQIISKEFINKLPNLKVIIRYGAGYDNVDISYAKEKGIIVCNTPDYGTDEVSDTALAMIMNIARGISRYDYLSHFYKDTWQENTLPFIKRNCEYKLGVIGAGRIGASLLLKSNALRFDTHFYDPYVARGFEKTIASKRVETIDELLQTCDIISLNCPLTQETKNMVNLSFINKMKKGSSLVNTARGAIIEDIDILYEALKSGQLNSIALDVLSLEPPKDSLLISDWRKKEKWLEGRLIINPHTAYYSKKAFYEMREKAALNAQRVLEGKTAFNIVNQLSINI